MVSAPNLFLVSKQFLDGPDGNFSIGTGQNIAASKTNCSFTLPREWFLFQRTITDLNNEQTQNNTYGLQLKLADVNNTTSQSEFEANICNWCQARENACVQNTIGFG